MSKWKKGKKFYKRSALGIFSFLWICIPVIAVASYFLQCGDFVQDTTKETYDKFLAVATPTQAAIVGIIIPIIFALVEQIFKNQDTFFKAFMYWSKVVQLILSSLLLVLFLMAQLALPLNISPLVYVSTFLWLAFNIWGTIRLVLVSLSFFFPKRRFDLILSYIGQIVLPVEIKQNLNISIRQAHGVSELLFKGFFQKIIDRLTLRKSDCPKTEEILHHLSVPVLESIRNGAHEEFQNQLKFLIEAHAFLIVESGVVGEENDNYATLSTNQFWGMEQFRNWNDPYRQIIAECVSKIEHDDRFFRTCSHYCVLDPYRRIAGKSPQRITGSAIEWATMVHYSLMKHIFKLAAANLDESVAVGHEVTMPAYLNNTYLASIKIYIGSWESLRQSIVIKLKDKEKPLDVKYLQDLETHLRESVFSICRSVSNGDKNGALWLLDTFLRWNDNLPRLGQSGWRIEANSDLSRNFLQTIETLGLDHTEDERHDAIVTIYNLWFDTALTLYGLLWSFSDQTKSDFPKEIAAQLYSQKLMDTSSRSDTLYRKLSKGKDLLYSFIRIMVDPQYESRITDSLGRGFRSPFDGAKISGRCYVGSGGNYLYETFANLLIAHAHNKKVVHEHHLNEAFEFLLENGEHVGTILISLGALINALQSRSVDQIQAIYSFTSVTEISAAKAKYYKKASILRVESFRDELQNLYNQTVIEAEISQDIIKVKRAEVERQIFDNIENKYPINLFSQASYTDPYATQPLAKAANLHIRTCPKEVFVEPEPRLKVMPDDTLTMFSSLCEENVLNWPLSLALNNLGRQEYKPTSPNDFWELFKTAIHRVQGNGQTPIILDSTGYVHFLDVWEHDFQREPVRPTDFVHGFEKSFESKYGNKYMKHLYNTPVFEWRLRGTNGFIILGKEQLQEVLFRRYADNAILDLDFKPFDETPEQGAVVYQWEYEAKVLGVEAHYISVAGLNEEG